MEDKVRNYPEMEAAIQRIDWVNLYRTPNFEPRRGPGVPRFVAAAGAPLLYMPLQPVSDAPLRTWMAQIGDGGLIDDFTQKTLRAWMRKSRGYRSFTVLRHPLTRANDIFSAVLTREWLVEFRESLRAHHAVPLPPDDAIEGMPPEDYRTALLAFLRFVKASLNGQAGQKPDILWASQTTLVQGLASFSTPDLLCREDRLDRDLGFLTDAVGAQTAPPPKALDSAAHVPLTEIYDEELEAAARDTYPRDYITFGFTKWKKKRGHSGVSGLASGGL